MSENFLDVVEPSEALQILKILSKNDAILEKQIEKIFFGQIRTSDMDDIAADVLADLDFIDVEDLWARSGSTRHGYVDCGEEAWAMIEEVVEPYIEKMKSYHALKMFREEMIYCMGLISALHEFENESESEFKDWAPDAAVSIADNILSTWKDSCKDSEFIQEMENFIKKKDLAK